MIEYLEVNGAKTNVPAKGGWTALHVAAKNGHVEVVKTLMTKVSVDSEIRSEVLSPIYLAAHSGHARVVKVLLSNYQYANVATKDGWTPIHVAS